MRTSFLSPDELSRLGLRSFGEQVQISRFARIYGAERISVGDRVRIDDFAILSGGEGGIEIGSNVHIAAYSSLIGAGRIKVGDFANISSRVAIYSSSDDYSGATMTNPTVPEAYKAVSHKPVSIGRHAIVGSGSVVLPGVTIGEGCAIGALSLATRSCEEFGIYAGAPARRIKNRKRNLLDLEQAYLRDQKETT